MDDDTASPLRALRDQRGWLQEDTAARLGLDRRTYSAYETGRRPPPADVLSHVADLYGLSPAKLGELTRWVGGLRTVLGTGATP